MISNIIFLVLAAGVPYYLLLEKIPGVKSKHIFLISVFLLMSAVALTFYLDTEHNPFFVVISLTSAIFSIYKARQTTNFYKFAYYLIFVNAPFFIYFEGQGAMHSVSLLVSLVGIYLIARFYEKNYGSANYRYITGITLIRPYIGTYLTFYLIGLALYPPFPNSLFFLNYMFHSEPNLLWYVVVITLFFGNFHLAMGVMRKTLFGRPNPHIHYVQMSSMEKATHTLIMVLLLLLSAYGIKEMLL